MGILQNKRVYNVIGNQDHHARYHHRRGGGQADTFGAVAVRAHMCKKTLKTANGDNQKSEDDGLDKASRNVIDLGAWHHPVKVRTGVDPQDQAAADPGADNTDKVEKSG